MKKQTKTIIGILLLAVLFILPVLNNLLFGDAIQWGRFYCTGQYWFEDIGHPSLPGWLTNISCALFGVWSWSIRLPFLLVALATICFVYLYGRKLFGERTALLSAFLLAINSWFVSISMATTQDNYLMLFFTLGLFSYLSWLKKPEKKQVFFLALIFGLCLITKTSAILLPGIILAHQAWLVIKKKQKLQKTLKLWPAVLGLTIPITYYAIQFVAGLTAHTGYTLHRTFIKLITAGGYAFPTGSWLMTVVLASPAFFALLLLAAKNKKLNEKTSLLWFWILVPAIVYSFFIINNNIERFLQVSLPAMALLVSGFVLSVVPRPLKFFEKNKELFWCSAGSVFVLLAAYFLPTPTKYAMPYYSLRAQLIALSRPFSYFFPIISDMGPTFYLPVVFVIASGIVGLVWFCIAVFATKIWSKKAVVLLLVTTIATNGIIIAENDFSFKGPNVPAMSKVMNEALIENAQNGDNVLIIGAHQVDYPWRNEDRLRPNLSRMYLSINSTEGGVFVDSETGVSIRKAGIILLRSEKEFSELTKMVYDADLVLFEDYPPLPENNVLKQALKACPSIVVAEHRGLEFSLRECVTNKNDALVRLKE